MQIGPFLLYLFLKEFLTMQLKFVIYFQLISWGKYTFKVFILLLWQHIVYDIKWVNPTWSGLILLFICSWALITNVFEQFCVCGHHRYYWLVNLLSHVLVCLCDQDNAVRKTPMVLFLIFHFPKGWEQFFSLSFHFVFLFFLLLLCVVTAYSRQ